MTAPHDPVVVLRDAAHALRNRAAVTTFADLSVLYAELAQIIEGGAEAVASRDLEIGVLRTELAGANQRAAMNAENARLWFDRVMALGALPPLDGYMPPAYVGPPPWVIGPQSAKAEEAA